MQVCGNVAVCDRRRRSSVYTVIDTHEMQIYVKPSRFHYLHSTPPSFPPLHIHSYKNTSSQAYSFSHAEITMDHAHTHQYHTEKRHCGEGYSGTSTVKIERKTENSPPKGGPAGGGGWIAKAKAMAPKTRTMPRTYRLFGWRHYCLSCLSYF